MSLSPADTDDAPLNPTVPWLPAPNLLRAPANPESATNPQGAPAALSGLQAPPRPAPPSPHAFQAMTRDATVRGPAAAASKPKQSRFALVLAWLVVIGIFAGAGVVLFREQLTGTKGPDQPDAWDPRVASVISFVEDERQLEFKHPIYIDFLPEAEFVALVSGPVAGEIDEATRAAYDEYSLIYDAMGLTAGYDMLAGQSTFSTVSTLGFYSPELDRISIRGDVLSPTVRLTLIHELVHALQAQHFDLTLGGPDDLELRAIVEADAMRIENVYLGLMTPADQASGTAGSTSTPEQDALLATVPFAVVQQRQAPYVLGPQLVQLVYDNEGNAGIDRMILDPPGENVLISPTLYGTDAPKIEVEVTAPEGSTVIEAPQPLSMLDTLIMLDAWLPWGMARSSLDGWLGGGYVSYHKGGPDGPVCFTATLTFAVASRNASRTNPANNFATAMQWWAGAAHSTAVPVITDTQVTFEACARGTAAIVPPAPVISTLTAALIEEELIVEGTENAVQSGNVSPPLVLHRIAACLARTLIDDPVVAPLLVGAAWTPEQEALITNVSGPAWTACAAEFGMI